jgi:hypothetical protein
MNAEGKFEKVQYSDTALYGPEKLVLCGFSYKTQSLFKKVLQKADLSHVEKVWVNESQKKKKLIELLDLSDNTGMGKPSTLPRAIVVSGITENQLHTLIAICRAAGMKNALWAALTPTSEKWPIGQLLKELESERQALAGQSKN